MRDGDCIDLTGRTYGDRTVMWYAGYGYWMVHCERCGQTRTALGSSLASERCACARNQLSDREREVAQLVARGLHNKEIARKMSISDRTVQTHLSRIFAKFGLCNRTELALMIDRGEI